MLTFNTRCAGVKGSHKNLQLADVASFYYSCVEAAQGSGSVSLPLGRTRSDTHSHGGMRKKSTEGRGLVFCRVRLEKMDSVKEKEKKHKRGQQEADVSQSYCTSWTEY